jgi:hypothetical protein
MKAMTDSSCIMLNTKVEGTLKLKAACLFLSTRVENSLTVPFYNISPTYSTQGSCMSFPTVSQTTYQPDRTNPTILRAGYCHLHVPQFANVDTRLRIHPHSPDMQERYLADVRECSGTLEKRWAIDPRFTMPNHMEP